MDAFLNDWVPALISSFWPGAVLLVILYLIKRGDAIVQPIVVNVVSGLARTAQTNATAVMIMIGFGLSASLSAFWDVFHSLDKASMTSMSLHQYFSLWAKVLNPFIVAVLAKATNTSTIGTTPAPNPAATVPTGRTAAPFPTTGASPS